MTPKIGKHYRIMAMATIDAVGPCVRINGRFFDIRLKAWTADACDRDMSCEIDEVRPATREEIAYALAQAKARRSGW